MGVGISLAPSNLPTENINVASMNVKVPTKKVVAALEKRLQEIRELESAWEKFKKDKEVWEKSLATLDTTNWKVRSTLFRTYSYKHTIDIEYDVPKAVLATCPKEPSKQLGWEERSAIGELESAIRILKMTDEEAVSASTFKSVSRFL
jgi:hypothetical protein